VDYACFDLRWQNENIFLNIYAHELSRYTFHWHETDYEINVILKGKAEYTREGKIYLVESDDVILINRNEGHGSFAMENGTISLAFKFSASSLGKYMEQGEEFRFHCISNKNTKWNPEFCKIRYFIFEILNAAMCDSPYSHITAKASLEMLLSVLFRFFPHEIVPMISRRDESRNRAIRNIMKYINRNYKNKITLDDLARVSKYNRTYVSTFFKDNLGINFYKYLTRVRFQNAVFELDDMDKNLTEIAIENGFPDLKTFNRMFQEIFHMYPAEYRAKAKKIEPRKGHEKLRYCTRDNELLYKKLREYVFF